MTLQPNRLVIRFIDEPDAFSRAITFVTDSLFCHTECLSRDATGWVGAHAGTGVEKRALDWVKPSRERVYAIPVTLSQYQKAHTWLEMQMGCKYNYLDILGLFFHRRIWSPQRVICSQLMLEFMQEAGLQPLNVLPDYSALITPETLHLSPLFIGRSIKLV